MLTWVLTGTLFGLLAIAVWFDLHSRRVPNLLVSIGIALGVALQTATTGWPGTQSALLGGLLGLALLLPFYVLRAMGAGDVKLLAAVGTFLGPKLIVAAWLATLLAGGIISIFAAIAGGHLRRTLTNLQLMLSSITPHALSRPTASEQEINNAIRDGSRLPYSLAIALGTCATLAYRAIA